ncbi:SPFH domain-containing protein [Candidatus Nomurabacteria bacterium]|nr:SPFH domain-containing protein [Candidatus Nomurabacteria bacterium]
MTSRILGAVCALFVLASAYMVFSEFSWSWSWLLLVVWTIVLSSWYMGGWKKIGGDELGWRAAILLLGQRTSGEVGEGWQWVPFPFGIKPVDCRETIIKLDALDVFTSDTVPVKIDGSIAIEIVDINLYLSVNPAGLKQGLDDLWDEAIRNKVATIALDQLLLSKETLEKHAHIVLNPEDEEKKPRNRWGFKVTGVIVSKISPDQKMTDDLELAAREERQRKGQRVQAKHQAELIKFFSGHEKLGTDGPEGPGLSAELAYEASLIHMDKAEPKKLSSSTFGLDPAIVTAIVDELRRRRP